MPRHVKEHTGDRGATPRRAGEPVRAVAVGALLPILIALALLAGPAAVAGSVPCDCESCHGQYHPAGFTGCSSCHESPPQDATHRTHFGGAPADVVRYGDTSVTSTAEAYKFGCGNCHPLSRTKHMNGTVDKELYDPAAPAGSLKAKNPSSAAYDPVARTCRDVYCHSGYTVVSSAVGEPLTSPPSQVPTGFTLNNGYIMDPTCSSLTYAPYTVATSRVYVTTPPWGQAFASPRTCSECHGFPPTTSDPSVSAGVGDSHQWVDAWGFRNLHAWNMGFDPVPCRTCHHLTVTQAGAYSPALGEGAVVYDAVPLASRAPHVNGVPDVAFDTTDAVVYRNAYSLAGAAYDPATKTCANVACHASASVGRTGPRWQQQARWGAPYRWEWGSAECDLCHRTASLGTTCQPAH